MASSGGRSVAEKLIVAVPRGVALERAVGLEGPAILMTVYFILFIFISYDTLTVICDSTVVLDVVVCWGLTNALSFFQVE